MNARAQLPRWLASGPITVSAVVGAPVMFNGTENVIPTVEVTRNFNWLGAPSYYTLEGQELTPHGRTKIFARSPLPIENRTTYSPPERERRYTLTTPGSTSTIGACAAMRPMTFVLRPRKVRTHTRRVPNKIAEAGLRLPSKYGVKTARIAAGVTSLLLAPQALASLGADAVNPLDRVVLFALGFGVFCMPIAAVTFAAINALVCNKQRSRKSVALQGVIFGCLAWIAASVVMAVGAYGGASDPTAPGLTTMVLLAIASGAFARSEPQAKPVVQLPSSP